MVLRWLNSSPKRPIGTVGHHIRYWWYFRALESVGLRDWRMPSGRSWGWWTFDFWNRDKRRAARDKMWYDYVTLHYFTDPSTGLPYTDEDD